MRGVSLGLFDEKTAWEKFESWNADHEQLVAKREESHRQHKADKRHAAMSESVRKVEEKYAAKAAAQVAEAEADAAEADAAEGEAPATENQEG
jgi:small subunit ribosomal protein S16